MMRNIKRLIIHCAYTPKGMDIGFSEIDDWHEQRGWRSPSGIHCGYHDIIRRDGTVEKGRPLEETGAHTRGHNHDSIGICLVGGKEDGEPAFNFTQWQFCSLHDLIAQYVEQYPDILITGHHQYDAGKQCPCFDVQSWFTAR